MEYFHQPVLLKEVLEYLQPAPGKNFIDGTLGGGGHALSLLEMSSPNGQLLGLDKDPLAIQVATKNLKKYLAHWIVEKISPKTDFL